MKKMLRSAAAGLMVAALLFGGVAYAASYQVVRGDSLWRIAQKYSTSVVALKQANKLTGDTIYPGQQLTVPDRQYRLDPYAPSGGQYPVIKKGDNIWIDVPIRDQRVRIMKGSQVIYSMVTSSGMEPTHATPRGTYYIEPERGTWFFSQKYQEGAQYWVSFKGHGIYLFHTVVMDGNQRLIDSEANKLGQKASHGCLRLTVSDARWIYENIPTGTKVVIHD